MRQSEGLETLPDCVTYKPSGLISRLVLVTLIPLFLVIVYLQPGSSMSLMIPLDHSGLFEFLSGFFLPYSTQLPRLSGTNSLLPVWYLVESSLHSLALYDKSLACCITGILVLKCLLHKSSARLFAYPSHGC